MKNKQRLAKALGTFRNFLRDILINYPKRKQLNNTHFSIICNDCTGGMILHDLKMEFRTPTINMWCSANDFIKFISNLEYYLSQEPVEFPNDDYPITLISDIKWHCIHYSNFVIAKKKWEERKKRINFENLYIIFNDRNGCTENEICEFEKLEYINKVCFTHKKWKKYKSTWYIAGSEDKECLDDATSYTSKFGIKRRYDYFDFVTFLDK